MEVRLFFLLIAVILTVLILLLPRMVRFRIKVLRKLKWNGLANFHENYFDRLVMIVRIVMALIVAYL